MTEHEQRFSVVIAGSGPAAIEAALRLRTLASELVSVIIVTPNADTATLPMTAVAPFARSGTQRYPLTALARDTDAEIRRGTLARVDVDAQRAWTTDGSTLAYDALLVAVGGTSSAPYSRALAFGGPNTDERMHGLVQDLEAGYVRRVAFVVPPGASWPLPLYELALMTAERAFEMCAHVELSLITPEASPLGLFGPDSSREVAAWLQVAGIELITDTRASVPTPRVVELGTGGDRLNVDRVVTLPVLTGPHIEGLPQDDDGFLPVDEHGRVRGAEGVYAAGDATDFPIKQGGIACQQAEAAADAIAATAGAAVEPAAFAPVLRAVLLTGYDARWLERDLRPPERAPAAVAGPEPGAPWTKIAGRELSWHLARIPARMQR